MATKTIVQKIDDIDGSEATTTVHIGYQGADYLVDLNDVHATELDDFLRELIAVADAIKPEEVQRPRRGKSAGAATKIDGPAIRAWANENGYEIGDRGRIPATIIEAYNERAPKS